MSGIDGVIYIKWTDIAGEPEADDAFQWMLRDALAVRLTI